MKIDFSTYSDAGLALLIEAASKELAQRLSGQGPEIIRTQAPAQTVVIDEPPADDKDFCLMLKRHLQNGAYITADERRRCAEIAEKHPEWVRRQQLPTDKGTGSWRKAAQYLSAGRARER